MKQNKTEEKQKNVEENLKRFGKTTSNIYGMDITNANNIFYTYTII